MLLVVIIAFFIIGFMFSAVNSTVADLNKKTAEMQAETARNLASLNSNN